MFFALVLLSPPGWWVNNESTWVSHKPIFWTASPKNGKRQWEIEWDSMRSEVNLQSTWNQKNTFKILFPKRFLWFDLFQQRVSSGFCRHLALQEAVLDTFHPRHPALQHRLNSLQGTWRQRLRTPESEDFLDTAMHERNPWDPLRKWKLKDQKMEGLPAI